MFATTATGVSAPMIANQAAQILRSLRDAIAAEEAFYGWLTMQQDTDLEALGFAAADVTTLRAAFNDMHALSEISNGAATPDGYTLPMNFTTNSTLVIGPQ